MPLSNPSPSVTTDGWTQDSAYTWTRASNTTFTVAGVDVTAQFPKGTRLKVTDTTTKYFVVVSASFSTDTTVTFTGGSDYTLAATPTAQYYSYAANPQGYPSYFNFTPTFGGFSADPAVNSCGFSIVGKLCHYWVNIGDGTSNATTTTVTMPVSVAGGSYNVAARIKNNGTLGTAAGLLEFAGGATLNVYRDGSGAAWTASGAKSFQFTMHFWI